MSEKHWAFDLLDELDTFAADRNYRRLAVLVEESRLALEQELQDGTDSADPDLRENIVPIRVRSDS